MKIYKLEIERFLGIRNLALAIRSNPQVIAGQNNAGKTTILRALELFFNPGTERTPDSYQPKNQYYRDEGARSLTRVRLYFNELSAEERTTFAAALRNDHSFWSECRITRSGKVSYIASKDASGDDHHRRVCERFGIVHVPAVRVAQSGIAAAESQRLMATARDVLVRSRPGPQTKLQQRFAKFCEQLTAVVQEVLNDSREAASEILPRGVQLDFITPDALTLAKAVLGETRIQTNSGIEILLQDEGTGFQSLLSLGLLRHVASKSHARSANVLFLIEEPEAFLHPHNQKIVSSYLSQLSADAQVIVTTHSSIVVDSVSISDVARLPRNTAGLTVDWHPAPLGDAKRGVLSRYCDAKNSEIVFADGVIFCEGLSDSGAIRFLLDARLGYDHAQDNVSIIDMGSADKATHFVELARHFDIPYIVILDKDSYAAAERKIVAICQATGSPLNQEELLVIDTAAAVNCSTAKEAAQTRDTVNDVLMRRHIFCLGSDIEGAVALSYTKPSILHALGPEGARHLNADNVTELNELSGRAFDERLWKLVGSKSWNTEKASKDHKPKPHVLPMAISIVTGRRRRNSDLSALEGAILEFVRNLKPTDPVANQVDAV